MTDTFPLDELRALQKQIGAANAEKGFHEEGDFWRAQSVNDDLGDPAILRNYYTARLALIVTEAAEAIEELRNGRAVDEVWYSAKTGLGNYAWYAGETPDSLPDGTVGKPEGVPSEIADVVIRAFDFADEAGIDLAAVIQEKLAYNATRARMHGRTF